MSKPRGAVSCLALSQWLALGYGLEIESLEALTLFGEAMIIETTIRHRIALWRIGQ